MICGVLRSRPRRGQGEGARCEVGGDVYPDARRQFHHPVRTPQVADIGDKGARAATGTRRALPDDSRHDRSDRLHDCLGIHRVRELAGESNEDLVAALDATSALSSNRIEFQELQPTSAGVLACSARQGERDLSMELSMTSSLRMQAVRATFFGLPAVRSRW